MCPRASSRPGSPLLFIEFGLRTVAGSRLGSLVWVQVKMGRSWLIQEQVVNTSLTLVW